MSGDASGTEDGLTSLHISFTCPTCDRPRVFSVLRRAGRLRMVCPDCAADLPARVGPVRDWRDLVHGPPVRSEVDKARMLPLQNADDDDNPSE